MSTDREAGNHPKELTHAQHTMSIDALYPPDPLADDPEPSGPLHPLARLATSANMAVADYTEIARQLTLDEARPVSARSVREIEIRALRKVRTALAQRGITSPGDLFP